MLGLQNNQVVCYSAELSRVTERRDIFSEETRVGPRGRGDKRPRERVHVGEENARVREEREKRERREREERETDKLESQSIKLERERMCVCVCVCVRERERSNVRGRDSGTRETRVETRDESRETMRDER